MIPGKRIKQQAAQGKQPTCRAGADVHQHRGAFHSGDGPGSLPDDHQGNEDPNEDQRRDAEEPNEDAYTAPGTPPDRSLRSPAEGAATVGALRCCNRSGACRLIAIPGPALWATKHADLAHFRKVEQVLATPANVRGHPDSPADGITRPFPQPARLPPGRGNGGPASMLPSKDGFYRQPEQPAQQRDTPQADANDKEQK